MMPENNRTEKLRLFVAIFPPTAVLAALETVQEQLKKLVPPSAIRCAQLEQVHLTLEFLGYVESNRVGEFQKVIEQITDETGVLSISCESVGCFPNRQRPQIIWAGLKSTGLLQLKEKLDIALRNLGHETEKRKFLPHLTLGRATHLSGAQARQISRQLSRVESTIFGEWRVDEIKLMQSDLSSTGAIYSILQTFPLGKG